MTKQEMCANAIDAQITKGGPFTNADIRAAVEAGGHVITKPKSFNSLICSELRRRIDAGAVRRVDKGLYEVVVTGEPKSNPHLPQTYYPIDAQTFTKAQAKHMNGVIEQRLREPGEPPSTEVQSNDGPGNDDDGLIIEEQRRALEQIADLMGVHHKNVTASQIAKSVFSALDRARYRASEREGFLWGEIERLAARNAVLDIRSRMGRTLAMESDKSF